MEPSKDTDPLVKRIQHLFTKLESSQSVTCFRALTELRGEFVTKPQLLPLFIQAGGLKHIILQLKKSNKKIVDVSLSILGHCVLEQEPRNMFRKQGGLPILKRVLRSFEDETAILSRGCRAVGSLAQDKRVVTSLVIEHSIYDTIGQIIDRSSDEETLCMAIRAIHNLSDCKEHVAVLGRNYIYPKLAKLLIKTDNVKIQKKLFSTLPYVYSYMSRFSESSAHYWVGEEEGAKLIARLVELRTSSTTDIATKAPQLLYQLVKDNHVRSSLAGKPAFEALIPIIKEEVETGKCGTTVYVSCFLLLCRESPLNCSEVGGIPLLLELIKESEPFQSTDKSKPQQSQRFRSQHTNIFSTLLSFKYDATSLAELVNEGVVEILTSKVVRYTEHYRSGRLGSSSTYHSRDTETSPTQNDTMTEELAGGRNQTVCHAGCKIRCRSRKQYRTTSPSYQAIEMEYDQFFRESTRANSSALNIFGWNPDRPQTESEAISGASSPRSMSSSPTHSLSTWSESSSEGDAGSDYSSGNASPTFSLSSPVYSSSSPASPTSDSCMSPTNSSVTESMSPLLPPTLPSTSDFEQSDNEEEDPTICYSPANVDVDLDSEGERLSSSPTLPSKKRARSCQNEQHDRRLCCETDLKMLWLKLGLADGKDYYENWPEFSSEQNQGHQQEVAIYLLLKISWMKDTPKQLTNRKTVKAIIDYLVETPRPTFRACQFLFRLASCHSFFVCLLRTHFPLEVYLGIHRRPGMLHCCPLHSSLRRVGEQILDQMASIVAQFGRGEIEHILIRSADDTSSSGVIAMAAPLIVKSRCLLQRYVNDLQILDTIGNQLYSPESRAYAAASLSSLGSFLKMDDLLSPPTSFNDVFTHGSCKVVGAKDDVFFQVLPNETIGGVKSFLQGASFFEAMFRGGFQESQSEIVQLVDIKAPVLKVVLHFVYGCGCQCNVIRSVERLLICDQLALNLLWTLDRFLMLEQLESISNLIANQDWINSPNMFVAFLTSLDSAFSFVTKLSNHLHYFPFSSAADFDSRFKIIDAVLKTDAADDAINRWKRMFLSRIEERS